MGEKVDVVPRYVNTIVKLNIEKTKQYNHNEHNTAHTHPYTHTHLDGAHTQANRNRNEKKNELTNEINANLMTKTRAANTTSSLQAKEKRSQIELEL